MMAFDEGKVVGYLLTYRLSRFDNHGDMFHIYHLFVLPSYQRQHIASNLMNRILSYAKEESIHYVYLITQTDNDPANQLYERLEGELHPRNKNVYYWYVKGRPRD